MTSTWEATAFVVLLFLFVLVNISYTTQNKNVKVTSNTIHKAKLNKYNILHSFFVCFCFSGAIPSFFDFSF